MKHLKTFENFRLIESEGYPSVEEMKAHLCNCGYTPEECDAMSYEEICSSWEESHSVANEGKKAKPDFLDLDKDGNKKESMKKAAADKKKKEGKSEKPAKLTAAQKKLPEGLRKAIEAKKK